MHFPNVESRIVAATVAHTHPLPHKQAVNVCIGQLRPQSCISVRAGARTTHVDGARIASLQQKKIHHWAGHALDE
jgi:hypothetical protein